MPMPPFIRVLVRGDTDHNSVDRRGNARLAIVGVRTGLHLQEGQTLLEWLKTA